MTPDQLLLLSRIKNEFPIGWFTSKQIKATIARLQALVKLGYLEVGQSQYSPAIQFKLRPSHLWPEGG